VKLGGKDSFSVAQVLAERGIPFAFATGDSGLSAASVFKDPLLLQKPFVFDEVKSVLGKILALREPVPE
jgi:hypothetical protein